MKKILFTIFIFSNILNANSNNKLLLNVDNEIIKNEIAYGINNNYSNIIIGHKITNNNFVYYYGTNIGLIMEEENIKNFSGFKIKNEVEILLSAKIGMKIKFKSINYFKIEAVHELEKNNLINSNNKLLYSFNYRF